MKTNYASTRKKNTLNYDILIYYDPEKQLNIIQKSYKVYLLPIVADIFLLQVPNKIRYTFPNYLSFLSQNVLAVCLDKSVKPFQTVSFTNTYYIILTNE